jgi:hypothetical protein
MEGVANLADVMLVLAVGLMLALVINWNINVAPAESAEVSEIEGFTDGDLAEIMPDQRYEQMNVVVYRNNATGQYYVVEKGNE